MENKREKMINEFYTILDQWLTLYEENDNLIERTLLFQNFRNIGIYGMGTMGYHLIQTLRNSEIHTKYIIDSEHRKFCDGIKTVTINDNLEGMEVLIYTNPFENRETLENIKQKYNVPVVYLGDLVFGNI